MAEWWAAWVRLKALEYTLHMLQLCTDCVI